MGKYLQEFSGESQATVNIHEQIQGAIVRGKKLHLLLLMDIRYILFPSRKEHKLMQERKKEKIKERRLKITKHIMKSLFSLLKQTFFVEMW